MDINPKEKFYKYFSEFVSQAVLGTIVAYWRFTSDEGAFKNISQEEMISKFKSQTELIDNLKMYFNDCWKKLYIKDDEFVFAKFSMLMLYGKFKHESCIFGFVWDFSLNILKFVLICTDKLNLKNKDSLKESVKFVIKLVMEQHEADIFNKSWGCDANCKPYIYKKNEDFIFFK